MNLALNLHNIFLMIHETSNRDPYKSTALLFLLFIITTPQQFIT